MIQPSDLDLVDVGSLLNTNADFLVNGNIINSHQDFEIDTKVMQYNGMYPMSTGPPKKDNFPGVYNFHVEINSAYTQKNKFLYSHKIHRIYVDMKQNFSVNFNWNTSYLPQPMFVRATVVFSDPSQAEKRVERCSTHYFEKCESDMSVAEKKNVLRSARASGSPDVFYCGDPAQVNSWYSVLVQFLAPSSHAYLFVCKSSCSSGINRRAISIIFTLEDITGNVLGQDSVGVRVCSCPRRDLRRDENGQPPAGKRKMAPRDVSAPADVTKTPRLERREDQLVPLPQITVVGHSTVVTGLTVMLNMMKQARHHRAAGQQSVEDFDKAINDIQHQIEVLENPTPGAKIEVLENPTPGAN